MFVATATDARAAVDLVSFGDCPSPVRIERIGETASWQTKQRLRQIVPFAVESGDRHTWLYVGNEGPQDQGRVSQTEFDRYKSLVVSALGALNNFHAVDSGPTLTITYEEPPDEGPVGRRIEAVKMILTAGCVVPLFMTSEDQRSADDVLRLLSLVYVGDRADH